MANFLSTILQKGLLKFILNIENFKDLIYKNGKSITQPFSPPFNMLHDELDIGCRIYLELGTSFRKQLKGRGEGWEI